MHKDSPHRWFQVVLRLNAPGPVPASAPDELVQLLTATGTGRWSSVTAEGTAGGVQLQLLLSASDEGDAACAAVDDVRALAGLDATFTRWLVDARGVRARELPT